MTNCHLWPGAGCDQSFLFTILIRCSFVTWVNPKQSGHCWSYLVNPCYLVTPGHKFIKCSCHLGKCKITSSQLVTPGNCSLLVISGHPMLPGHMSSPGHNWSYLSSHASCHCPHLVTAGHIWSSHATWSHVLNWSQTHQVFLCHLGRWKTYLVTTGHRPPHDLSRTEPHSLAKVLAHYLQSLFHLGKCETTWSQLVTPGHKLIRSFYLTWVNVKQPVHKLIRSFCLTWLNVKQPGHGWSPLTTQPPRESFGPLFPKAEEEKRNQICAMFF